MLFNSFGYLCVFLPVAVLGIRLLRRVGGVRVAQVGLLVCSAVFYGWSAPWNLLHLAGSILFNWVLAAKLGKAVQPAKKWWLEFGLVANLGYLCAYKYTPFLMSFFPGRGHESVVAGSFFPLGISFFTLTQIMYLVDTYEGAVKAGGLFEHALFISFFPYVLSGPLAKAKRMRKQLGDLAGKASAGNVARGLYLFSLGLFKKSVCAEAFAQVATYGFDSARHRSALEVIVYSAAYSMQIYFDFSGYSDMAIGSAEMLGIEIPRNFDAPFRSFSIIEFWERWHISLSSFIAAYMYTPLLRSFRKVTIGTAMLSTSLVMTVVGLWHGPAWTFVFFGMMHGAGLALNSFWRKQSPVKLPKWLSWVVSMLFVDTAFIFFRSPTLASAAVMWRELLGKESFWRVPNLIAMHARFSLPIFAPAIVVGLIAAFAGRSSEQRAREFVPSWSTALASTLLLIVAAVYTNSQLAAGFIYFKF